MCYSWHDDYFILFSYKMVLSKSENQMKTKGQPTYGRFFESSYLEYVNIVSLKIKTNKRSVLQFLPFNSMKETHFSALWKLYNTVVCVCVCVSAQSCLTLCDPMFYGPPGSSAHGILQVRMLEWVAIAYSKGPSPPRDWTHFSCISCIGRKMLYN